MKLDYTIKTPEEREKYVEKLLEETPKENLTHRYLSILSDYIIDAIDRKEGNREILTENRLATINRRETSFEGIASEFENGEDGVYNIAIKDKNVLLTPKIGITEEDLEQNPYLREWQKDMEEVKAQLEKAEGKQKWYLKKQLIAMRRDQYVIKQGGNISRSRNITPKSTPSLSLEENITMDEYGEPHSDAVVTLFNPDHVSAILCNYVGLTSQFETSFDDDMYYLLLEFKDLLEEMKKEEPFYYSIVKYKVEGEPNSTIQTNIEKEFGIKHSIEYISSLWRNKIPQYLAKKAQEKYIIYYYSNVKKGYWKKCSRCGQIKLAHQRFYSRNNTSKDGWYSICKECRNIPKEKATQFVKTVGKKG